VAFFFKSRQQIIIEQVEGILMVDTIELVEGKLKKNLSKDGKLPDVLSLWNRVREWNAQGGKTAIEAELKHAAKEIGSKANTDLASLKRLLKGVD